MQGNERGGQEIPLCPKRMTINTFTHDYYLLELPQNQTDPFYRQFSFYSEIRDYRGNHIAMAPVARIYGTNQLCQKCCCHIHGFFPHFYIKTEEYSKAFKTDPEFSRSFLMVLENLFQRAYCINKPIILEGEIEQKLDFYGYHEKAESFLKITLFNPMHISKMRELLDSQILGRPFQCYEAHINYFMQLFSERNVFGINEMNVAQFTFRKNMTPTVMQLFKKIDLTTRNFTQGGHDVIELEKKFPEAFNTLQKVSSCYIQVDFHIDDILNSFDDNYDLEQNASLDPDSSMDIESEDLGPSKRKFQVKITTALQEVWLDELKRRQKFGISQKPKGIIDYSLNIEGLFSSEEKDPLHINFLRKGCNKDLLVEMLRSSSRHQSVDQTDKLVINREIAENYTEVLAQEKERLVEKVKERWNYYGSRKATILSQIMSGQKGELPQWEQNVQQQQLAEIPSDEEQGENSDRADSSNEEELELCSRGEADKAIPPNNTLLYRNNYRHIRAKLRKQTFFHVCEYCHKIVRDCECSLCSTGAQEDRDNQDEKTKEKQTLKRASTLEKRYRPEPPSYSEVEGAVEHEHRRPYYSDFQDLFGYHKVNSMFPICLKTAQLLDRELKVVKDYNREPTTIKNSLKLPDYYRGHPCERLDSKKKEDTYKACTYRLRYEPRPPSYAEVQSSITVASGEQGASRLRRSTSIRPTKEDSFVSDLLVLHYQFIVRFPEQCQRHYGDPETDEIVCFSYCISNFKEYDRTVKGLILVQPCPEAQALDLHEYEDVYLVKDERGLLIVLINIIFRLDPDLLITFDQEKKGIRYLTQRGFAHSIAFPELVSRSCELEDLFEYINFRDFTVLKSEFLTRDILLCGNLLESHSRREAKPAELLFLEQRMKERLKRKPILRKKYHFDVDVKGRVNLNIYRVCEADLKLKSYSIEAIARHLFGEQICQFTDVELFRVYGSGQGVNFLLEYLDKRMQLQARMIVSLNILSVVIEKSKIFGADFISMMERGSQFRIESVMCRVTKKSGYLTLSASKKQVSNQSVLQCRPFVMEPPKEFFAEPVLLFDFQSLYPSVMIAYNICYSTCLGSTQNLFTSGKKKRLGVSECTNLDLHFLEQLLRDCEPAQLERALQNYVFITPNKVAFVKKNIRQGLIPRILLEFLVSRIMIKDSMRLYSKTKVKKLLKDRQQALKMFMNVMFGYTGATFTGRMPCSEIADSVVEVARYCLRIVIDHLNQHPKYKGKVLYGDTDSVFFQMPGYSVARCSQIGKELAKEMTGLFPYPMEMKFQKVYDGLFLVAKKRYYGRSYEPDAVSPKLQGKGLECVRRDGIPFTSHLMESMLNLILQSRDLSAVKKYFKGECSQILSNQKMENEFALAKEVKLLKYSEKSMPGHGFAAKRLDKIDPMLLPKYGERMKYFVVSASLKPLRNRSISVFEYVQSNRMSLDLDYYLRKQVIPQMQRTLSSLVNLDDWIASLDVRLTEEGKKSNEMKINKKCLRCKGEAYFALCEKCMGYTQEQIDRIESQNRHCQDICNHCIGPGSPIDSVKCVQWNCEHLWLRKKMKRNHDAIIPELVKLKEAIWELNL